MGFPIRKFSDQSLLAAPQDLSQRTTSFFASQRQGIHQIPLRHLIALIIDAHHAIPPRQKEMTLCECRSASQDTIEKTSLLKHIRARCGQATREDWKFG